MSYIFLQTLSLFFSQNVAVNPGESGIERVMFILKKNPLEVSCQL